MIGLDFGTTNSCVAIRTALGDVEAVSVATGNEPPYDTVLRTAVLDPDDLQPAIGHDALQRARAGAGQAMVSFKPFLDEHQLRRREARLVLSEHRFDPMEQAEVQDARPVSVWVGDRNSYTREQLIGGSAAILGHLLRAAVEAGGDPSELWLGVPVSFSSYARQRLLTALRTVTDATGKPFYSGYREVLESVRFLLEPVAVAAGPVMSEAFEPRDRETVLVFDHGGGTLDLSLVVYEWDGQFSCLMPRRELGAQGSRDVAGRSLDSAFRDALSKRADFATKVGSYPDYVVDEFVETCKIRLSDRDAAYALPGVLVSRDEFSAAVAPVLEEIAALVERVVADAGLTTADIDRVVMTGGSSLVPVVQRRVAELFPALDEYHLLAYDPTSADDTEVAITEVARGLCAFAQAVSDEQSLQQVVLWDVDLVASGAGDMLRVAQRGEAYGTSRDGSPRLTRRVRVPSRRGQGTSFGLYENQLGHRYLFGLAEAPALPEGASLEVEFRPDRITPVLRLLDSRGAVMERDTVIGGCWPSEAHTDADLLALNDEKELDEYFDRDALYLPARGFRRFECSPLVRPLREQDLVEWAIDPDGDGPRRDVRRYRGQVLEIYHQGERVSEMASLMLVEHRFRILRENGAVVLLEPEAGQLRLAARPGKDY